MSTRIASAATLLLGTLFSASVMAGGPECDSMKQSGHEHSAEYHKQVMPEGHPPLSWEQSKPAGQADDKASHQPVPAADKKPAVSI
ncbi:MAG: hypothetical protein AB1810_03730 [Pseudomonadota bacterium]